MEPPAVEQDAYLVPTPFLDADHPAVFEFATRSVGAASDAVGRATALYYAVRDRIRYDANDIDLRPDALRTSQVLARGRGFCVAKAVLLAAAARAVAIPSRLGFADVKNHLATPSMRRAMGTDLFVYHGYVELWLEGRWVKCTPAFNKALCERFEVDPLEFDGRHDSLFQQADREGNRYMEYLLDRGQYADLPLDQIRAAFETHYPTLVSDGVYAVRQGQGGKS